MISLFKKLIFVGLLKMLASRLTSRSQDDLAYEEYEDAVEAREREVEVMAAPSFISVSQRIEVNLGDTVRLPCMVDR